LFKLIVHPLVALGVPWIHEQAFFVLAELLFLIVTVKKGRKEGGGGILTETGNRNRNIRK